MRNIGVNRREIEWIVLRGEGDRVRGWGWGRCRRNRVKVMLRVMG